MTIQSKEKIQALKYVERKRRKIYFLTGAFLGISSAFAMIYCVKKMASKNTQRFHDEKDFYCSKFTTIKNALCEITAHVKENVCSTCSCDTNCCAVGCCDSNCCQDATDEKS